MFDSADVDRVGELDEFEVVRLMKKLNNSLATVKIQQKLKVLIPFCYLSRIILFFSYHLFDVTNWAFMCWCAILKLLTHLPFLLWYS